MATYDDFDGVYFTIQSIRLFHPEVAGDVDFLIVDNHPDGPHTDALRALGEKTPGVRYVPCARPRGTAVRDVVFREATAEFVLCADSHVLFAPGSLARLIDYVRAHRDTQRSPPGAAGIRRPDVDRDPLRARVAERHARRLGVRRSGRASGRRAVRDPDAGLGRLRLPPRGVARLQPPPSGDLGSEEGYIHEKFRRRGGRVMCLPFLRWAHRFIRPGGAPYRPTWKKRIRNYLVTHDELGWIRPPWSRTSASSSAPGGPIRSCAP